MRILLFVDDEPYLLLDNVKFAGYQLKSGRVVNGDWDLEINFNGQSCLRVDGRILRTWEYSAPYYYLTIPDDVQGTYQYVVGWAVNQDRSYRCQV